MKKMKATSILDYFDHLSFEGNLPDGIQIMNPYRDSSDIRDICHTFYHKYYHDSQPRRLILGINPGRLGAGSTGLPFTDTKRLNHDCKISYDKFSTHEPSSVFMYHMMNAYGSVESFYKEFYISSVCPLGFVKVEGKKVVNYNYYDQKELKDAMFDFIVRNIEQQIEIAGRSDVCFVLGTGKNFQFLNQLNESHRFFDKIIALEHPRFVMQYRVKVIDQYIQNYLNAFVQNDR